MRVFARKDGEQFKLPDGVEAIVIETSQGGIYLDVSGPVPDIVYVRATDTDDTQGRPGKARLIMSPESGRMSMGVVRT